MITKEQFSYIQSYKESKTVTEISKHLELDRSTVRKYIKLDEYSGNLSYDIDSLPVNKIRYYAYLLGLYLGDGYINKTERTYRLRISLNSTQHLDVIDRAKVRLEMLFPNNKIGLVNVTGANCVNLSVYNSNLVNLFPQHGVSYKHTRNIIITEKQEKLIQDYKDYLLCGLHDSDGCRYIDRRKVYYQFTNASNDILNIYLDCLTPHNIQYKLYPRNIRIRNKLDTEKIASLLQTCYSTLQFGV